MVVDLQEQGPCGNRLTLSSTDGGWGSCSGTITTKYNCAGTTPNTLQTQVTLTIEAGETYTSSITDSGIETGDWV
ncbi:hypothetical protein [Streptacidiphilus sp. P02-A3a]|uniref:hypothetical protein n=1 Tax=Streptacidiphilus sp. P02-A3a TaxID=2704468 RepID=UPI0015FCA1D5|nr:hypothetical protein [Streptacidiphilus sp. P02-A3a]QMU73214.1 hypothetical protein GXP74_38270 [Streptacidiphilus sp. P02-A3a]